MKTNPAYIRKCTDMEAYFNDLNSEALNTTDPKLNINPAAGFPV